MHGDCQSQALEPADPLVLYRATTFCTRLGGLYCHPVLSAHQGLFIKPCWAVHSLFMRNPIDVVFLDAQLGQLKQVCCLLPYRVTMCPGAAAVVELPGGYCQKYPEFLRHIHRALGAYETHLYL